MDFTGLLAFKFFINLRLEMFVTVIITLLSEVLVLISLYLCLCVCLRTMNNRSESY